MRILISSHAFAPSLGGIETVTRLLAQEFRHLGHEIAIVTQTPAPTPDAGPFLIVRAPGSSQLFSATRWCDVFWQNNLSLRTLWPALLLRKPIVVTHQGSYCAQPRGIDLAQRIKHAAVNRLTSVAISEYVAGCFKARSIVIPNPYDARTFKVRSPACIAEQSTAGRTSTPRGDLVFVGRLVSEKGVDLLLEALARLREIQPHLTIVGGGPEEQKLQTLAGKLGLQNQVAFVGAKQPNDIAEILNRHRILVVPSRYHEPFGVVALEGIACGCVVVGSRGGGLPEAIGPCGVTVPNGDVAALTDTLAKLLQSPDECDRLRAHGPPHLARFHPSTIAHAYVDLFQSRLSHG